LARYSPAYYTAFVYDTAGNISSGAIAIAYAPEVTLLPPEAPGEPSIEIFVPPLEPLSSTTQRMPDAFEILIKQGSEIYSFGEETVALTSAEPFQFYVAAGDVTSNVKSIIVRLQDPTDQRQFFSFLLRLNKEQTAYEAIVAPMEVVGESDVLFSVYDFRALRVAEYRTTLEFTEGDRTPTAADLRATDRVLWWQFVLVALGLLLLVIWWLLAKDRDDEEDEDKATVTSE
jgi:hypothetical protein